MEAFQIQLLRIYFDWKSGLQFKSHIRVIDKVRSPHLLPPYPRTHQQEFMSLKDYEETSAAVCLQAPPPPPSPPHPQNKINQSAAFDAERCRSIPRHDRESGPYRSSSHISHWLFTLLVKKALKGFGAKIYSWSAASFINIQIASKSSRTEPPLCPRSQKWNSRGAALGFSCKELQVRLHLCGPLNFWPKTGLYLEN